MFDWSKALTWFGISVAVVVGIILLFLVFAWIEDTFDLSDGFIRDVFLILMVCIGIGVLGGLIGGV